MKKLILWAVALIVTLLVFASCQTSSCNCGLGEAAQQEVQTNA